MTDRLKDMEMDDRFIETLSISRILIMAGVSEQVASRIYHALRGITPREMVKLSNEELKKKSGGKLGERGIEIIESGVNGLEFGWSVYSPEGKFNRAL